MNKLIYLLLFIIFIFLQLIAGHFYEEETLVVLLYTMISSFSKNFRPDLKNIFVPQNIAFLIFFVRLYLLPCLAIFFGYNTFFGNNEYELLWILKGYMITMAMFLAFVVGWEIKYSRSSVNDFQEKELSPSTIRLISITFLAFGLISLIVFFKDIDTYLQNIFLSTTAEEDLDEGNKFVTLFANLAKFFLPISVFGFFSLIDFENKTKVKKNLLMGFTILLTLVFTLNTNRQSMLYPILALLAGFSRHIKFKLLPILVIGLISLYFLFLFQDLRSSDTIDFTNSKSETKELVTNIQVYAGGAQMIAPIFNSNQRPHTIIYSFFHSVPVLGKSLRDKSGVTFYNQIYYEGAFDREDQVFLTQAECYVNGGYVFVFVFFLIIGYFYASFNVFYLSIENSQFFYRTVVFYLVLLFNSSIMLSIQTMGQFLFYNSLPALVVFYLYQKYNIHKNNELGDL